MTLRKLYQNWLAAAGPNTINASAYLPALLIANIIFYDEMQLVERKVTLSDKNVVSTSLNLCMNLYGGFQIIIDIRNKPVRNKFHSN